jgi:biofilm PGA synthesis N-glycosyltransferase PgaC
MLPFVILVVLLVGVSTILWSSIGLIRVIASWTTRGTGNEVQPRHPETKDVAVIIAAHNEEMVISGTLRSLEKLMPASNIYVVSDGSSDRTVDIVRAEGVNVLDLHPNRGKAGAIVEVLDYYDIPERYEVVLLLDADTQLTPNYFESGLPLFADDDVVAVAGRASTLTKPRPSTTVGRILVSYRNRVYIAMQYLFKFGQAAKYVNVVAIVPGFASMYRTRILSSIDIDAPDLKIEDYNMTFEVHAKKLGRIAFHPHAAIALTQDPDRFDDYLKQVERWNLGFWQTVIRHRVRFSKFWLALSLFIVELMISSVLLILLVPALAVTLMATVIVALGLDESGTAQILMDLLPPTLLILGIFIPDYALTILAAIVARKPQYLLMGFVFPLFRVVDAFLCVRGLVGALILPASHGSWKSPPRRGLEITAFERPRALESFDTIESTVPAGSSVSSSSRVG